MDRKDALSRLPGLARKIESSARVADRPGETRDLEAVAREIRTIWATLRVDTPRETE